MLGKICFWLLATVLLATVSSAAAQQPKKFHRIGYLSSFDPASDSARAEGIRLPAIYYRSDYVEAGGLMSYGVNFIDLNRRAATYVDKILKGAKPADLPVEQPTKLELIINLKTAKALNLRIPQSVLYRADKVIK
jgi:ABC-type uncharacterized transport system substrate-binding protein